MPEVDDLEPVDETLVVIVAEDDGDLFCLVDEDGAPAVFQSGDPEVEERVREARDIYGATARVLSRKTSSVSRAVSTSLGAES